MNHRLLIIEQPTPLFEAGLEPLLSSTTGYSCERVSWDGFRPDLLRQTAAHLIVPVAVPEPAVAMGLFSWLRGHPITLPILAVLPGKAHEDILRAASKVVDDFVLWPVWYAEFRYRVARILGTKPRDLEKIRTEFTEALGLAQLVGCDPAFVRELEKVLLVAPAEMPVLITGETGTGKELCARAIHHLSKRRSFPFIPFECGAVPDHLFENEFFGHARGAFTDAQSNQKGLVAIAEGGTLFLDEIDALSLPVQAKLLRFLEERVYKPLGGERFLRADVNIVAATNRDLESCVQNKEFRSDLYFRLNVLRLHLPPLRERSGDIEQLARHFLRLICLKGNLKPKTFSPGALSKLEQYGWPGNARELSNVVQRAVVFSPSEQILASHIELFAAVDPFDAPSTNFRQARALAVESFERRYLQALLRKHSGNITRAAREAGKDRRAFGRLVKKHGLSSRSS